MFDMIIRGGTIIDGTGEGPYQADIGIRDGVIVSVDNIKERAEKEIDASGKIVTPGFLDMHSHCDFTIPFNPDLESALGQGITTLFAGHCGMSSVPIHKAYTYSSFEDRAFDKVCITPLGGPNPGYNLTVETDVLRPAYKETLGADLDWVDQSGFYRHLEESGIAANFLNVVGHGQIRYQVLGGDNRRYSTPKEQEEIVRICGEMMDQGAAGISFGLDYDPGWWASDEELLAVAQCVADRGKILTTHYQLRGTRRGVTKRHSPVEGMIEVLEIARKTGVHLHLSHLTGTFDIYPEDDELLRAAAKRQLAIIQEYRAQGVKVTYDTICYYSGGDFWIPHLANRFLPYVKAAGGMKAFSERLKVGNYRDILEFELRNGHHASSSVLSAFNLEAFPQWGDDMNILSHTNPAYIGKTLGELSKEMGKDKIAVMLDLLEEDPYTAYNRWGKEIVSPVDKVFMQAEDMSISTDTMARNYDFYHGIGEDLPENLGSTGMFCGYVKFLEMKREEQEPLEKTIQKMTANGADMLGLTDRGRIKEGMRADIVVMDYENLRTNEDFLKVHVAPSGIDYVLVNGKIAVDHNVHTHVRSGEILNKRS